MSDNWDKYDEYIRSGGQDPLKRETFLINHITELTVQLKAQYVYIVRRADELDPSIDVYATAELAQKAAEAQGIDGPGYEEEPVLIEVLPYDQEVKFDPS